jgi:hypothetical protein
MLQMITYIYEHVRTVLRLIQPACLLGILNLKLHVGFDLRAHACMPDAHAAVYIYQMYIIKQKRVATNMLSVTVIYIYI